MQISQIAGDEHQNYLFRPQRRVVLSSLLCAWAPGPWLVSSNSKRFISSSCLLRASSASTFCLWSSVSAWSFLISRSCRRASLSSYCLLRLSSFSSSSLLNLSSFSSSSFLRYSSRSSSLRFSTNESNSAPSRPNILPNSINFTKLYDTQSTDVHTGWQ